jgi:predicted ATPase
MIYLIEAIGYKCLKYNSVPLESFHILVGPNGSGKSTFLDVSAFFAHMVTDGPEEAVLRRGQSLRELAWMGLQNEFSLAIRLRVPNRIAEQFPKVEKFDSCRFEVKIGIDPKEGGIRLLAENMYLIPKDWSDSKNEIESRQTELFPVEFEPQKDIIHGPRSTHRGWRKVVGWGERNQVYFRSETTDWNFPLRPGIQKSALAMIPEDERFPISNWTKKFFLEGIQVLQLNSRAMGAPCRPDSKKTFLPDGSNLPMVVRHLRDKEPKRFSLWLDHIRTVIPVKDIIVREREIDNFLYISILYDTGILVPSWLISDGTLRMLALTLLAYMPVREGVYLIEEPENGIHPKAVEAVFQSLSSVYEGQVLCATHSPLFLGLAKQSDLLCFAMTESGATDIVRGSEHPILKEWKGEVDIETLYAAGVLG